MLNVICQAVRPTTNSKITVMVPQHVGTNPCDCAQWIGEEFDWQFIPMSFEIKPEKQI